MGRRPPQRFLDLRDSHGERMSLYPKADPLSLTSSKKPSLRRFLCARDAGSLEGQVFVADGLENYWMLRCQGFVNGFEPFQHFIESDHQNIL